MKSLLKLAVLAIATGWVGLVVAESTSGSLAEEMKKCEVCKVMAEKPELMRNMTWETHKIDNGMLCVASVPKEQKKDFDATHKKMMEGVAKVKADMKAGKKVELCSFCQGMGDLEKIGAKHQEISTATGVISLFTSTDPAVVAKLHAHADKAIEEQRKMEHSKQLSSVE